MKLYTSPEFVYLVMVAIVIFLISR